MATLAPTVRERLARCGTRITVEGLVVGADVELSVNGTLFNYTATGGSHTFVVSPLDPNIPVQARQDAGSGFTPLSPVVTVEDVTLPPQSIPIMPPQVGTCSHCVWLSGLVPSCDVELFVGRTQVGSGVASPDGNGCFGVDLRTVQEPGAVLSARMLVCGQPGPFGASLLVAEPAKPPQPIVGEPVFGCQSAIPLSNLHPGARVRLESATHGPLGSFCSCWTAANVWIGATLTAGDQVRAQGYWDGQRNCKANGDWSDWRDVIPPDERIKPVVEQALIAGDNYIRVSNQIAGAELLVRILPSSAMSFQEYGPRPTSDQPAIALNGPLSAGDVIRVVQTLCGRSEESDPVTVLPLPPEIFAPVIVPPLYDCGAVVQVSNLYPGAIVRIYQDGIPCSLGWAGVNSSIAISAAPTLVAGTKVTAKQCVGNMESPESDGVIVQPLSELPKPVILAPVAYGDTTVWVSGVLPGARVEVFDASTKVGEAFAGEPIVRVGVNPVTDTLLARVSICDLSEQSDRVAPITDACNWGGFAQVSEHQASYDTYQVPDTEDGDPFKIQIYGQLYFPSDGKDALVEGATNLPLVVIAHGYHSWSSAPDGDPFSLPSYLGYDYLARHLASWGMVVFSMNMNEANALSNGVGASYQYARGEIILQGIASALNDPFLQGRIDPNRIGLIGHSMGGEAVVVAHFLNENQGRGFDIRGVCSIAPTNWRPEVPLRQTKYMQILGSMDTLVRSGVTPIWDGIRIYDRSERPKSHFWAYGIRHNPFNRQWLAHDDNLEDFFAAEALPPNDHERMAKCLITSFFLDALLDWQAYGSYMEGVILPPGIRDLEIYTQYSSEINRTVLDNFGDEDTQLGLVDEPIDPTDNRQGGQVEAIGPGLDTWQDIEFATLANSLHDTKGTELSWRQPNVLYRSVAGRISVGRDDWLLLRAAQFYEDATLNADELPIDFFVSLSDGAESATLRAGSVGLVPYPDAVPRPSSVMRTVRLPLSAFLAANQALDLGNIQEVQLWLAGRGTGHLLVDDLEFSR
jgi:dienelactone hydrolase